MIEAIFIILMGILGRMSGNGFGQKWGASWLPEAIMCIPYGAALGYVLWSVNPIVAVIAGVIGYAISYAGMQSATWYFLRWESHETDTTRNGTLKPVVDFIADRFGFKLGDEGYAWIGAAVKGFIIGLPVGGVLTALLWPLGYEIGSHAKGRVERFIPDSHAVSEFMSAALGAVSIVAFLALFN